MDKYDQYWIGALLSMVLASVSIIFAIMFSVFATIGFIGGMALMQQPLSKRAKIIQAVLMVTILSVVSYFVVNAMLQPQPETTTFGTPPIIQILLPVFLAAVIVAGIMFVVVYFRASNEKEETEVSK